MCMSSPSVPDPVPAAPPPAAPPPVTPTAVRPASENASDSGIKSKRKGTSSLRIDRSQPSTGGGTGLNIPT